MTRRRTLRPLVEAKQGLIVPGAYDGISAKLVQQAGFPAVYMTGYGTSASRLGLPDLGFAGLAEMVDHARNLVAVLDVPLIADADTGYGNALNVRRTVQMYEAAGVAALHIEDQVTPKRCGHLSGHQVIPRAEFTGKIRAAVEARTDPDLLVIARTDAISAVDADEALRRGRALHRGAPRRGRGRARGERLRDAAPLQLRARRPLAAPALRAAPGARLRDRAAAGGHAARGGPGDPRLPRRGEGARRRAGPQGPLHAVPRLQRADRRERAARPGRALHGRRALRDVGGEGRVPRAQVVLAERREVRVGQDRVRRPQRARPERCRRDRDDLRRDTRQLEDTPGEAVPARLPGVGEVIDLVRRPGEPPAH